MGKTLGPIRGKHFTRFTLSESRATLSRRGYSLLIVRRRLGAKICCFVKYLPCYLLRSLEYILHIQAMHEALRPLQRIPESL